MSFKYVPRSSYSAELDPERCVASVYRDKFNGQCARKGVLEHEGDMWCKTHHPPTATAKRNVRHAEQCAKWKAEQDERSYQLKMTRFGPKFIEALEQIAELNDGESEQIAREILEQFDREYK